MLSPTAILVASVLLLLAIIVFVFMKYRYKVFLFDYVMLNRPSVFLIMTILGVLAIIGGIFSIGVLFGDYDKERLISIFVQSSITEKDYPHFIFRMIVSVAGAVFFSGILVALITNIVMRRSAKQASGTLDYSLKDHYLVFGANSLLEAIAGDVDQIIRINKKTHKIGWLNCPQFVVVTSADPQAIHRRLCNYKNIRQALIVYSKDLTNNEILNNLNVKSAKKVFIIGDSEPENSDLVNIGILDKIVKNVSKPREESLPCFLSYSQERYVFSIDDDYLSKSGIRIELCPINHNHMALSNLWGWGAFARTFNKSEFYIYDREKINEFLLSEVIEKNNRNIVIIGINNIAEEVIKFICLRASYADNGICTHISVRTDDELAYERLKKLYSLDKIKNICINRIADKMIDGTTSQVSDQSRAPLFIIASANRDRVMTWIDYLSVGEDEFKPLVLAYADGAYRNLKKSKYENVEYFGLKDDRTFIRLGSEIYTQASYLYDASFLKESSPSFYELSPSSQRPWIIFANHLYGLLEKSGIRFTAAKVDSEEFDRRMKVQDFESNDTLRSAIHNLMEIAKLMYLRTSMGESCVEAAQYNKIEQHFGKILYTYQERIPGGNRAKRDVTKRNVRGLEEHLGTMIFVKEK